MSEKIEVVCPSCNTPWRCMEEDLGEIECPDCGVPLVRAEDAEPETPSDSVPGSAEGSAEESAEEAPNREAAEEPVAPPAPSSPDTEPPSTLDEGDLAGLDQMRIAYQAIRDELTKTIVGQEKVIEEVMVAILAGGHCLLEGVPGLAKTLLISSIAEALNLKFKRIQFTPDLMPSDITGTEVIQDDPETGRREFRFLAGPVFANIILADEINRTPPKTQAAMLEAMQEKQVSVGGTVHRLEKPFFVLATQNPLDQEGTYPLPEAQQDRFLFKIFVDYPEEADEKLIIRRVSEKTFLDIDPVLDGDDILNAQELVTRIPVADAVIEYATRIVRATRLGQADTPEFIQKWIAWGCGPRASINLIIAAKAVAALRGAPCASCEDVDRVVHPVMRHRLGLNYTARAEGITAEDITDMLLEHIPAY